jgi:hypothetical protein
MRGDLGDHAGFWPYHPPYAPGVTMWIHHGDEAQPAVFGFDAAPDQLERIRPRSRFAATPEVINPGAIREVRLQLPITPPAVLGRVTPPVVTRPGRRGWRSSSAASRWSLHRSWRWCSQRRFTVDRFREDLLSRVGVKSCGLACSAAGLRTGGALLNAVSPASLAGGRSADMRSTLYIARAIGRISGARPSSRDASSSASARSAS